MEERKCEKEKEEKGEMRKRALILLVLALLIATPLVFAGTNYIFLRYDGSDDYLEVADSVSLNMTGGDMTVELWFRTTDHSANVGLITKYNAGWTAYWYIDVTATDIHAEVSDGVDELNPNDAFTFWDGDWHHVLMTFDDSENNCTLWVDGEILDYDDVGPDVGDYDTDGFIAIGAYWDSVPVNSFEGDIDEIRIYDRVLTQTEITYSYTYLEPQSQTGLVMWLRCNEGTGGTTDDETANNNDGTLEPSYPSNAPIWADETPVISDASEASDSMLSILSRFLPIGGIALALGFILLTFSIMGLISMGPTMGESASIFIVPLIAMLSVGIILIVLGIMGTF